MNTIISKLFKTGFLHIFSSQLINKIISFCSAIILVRLLSKEEYGIFAYTSNILAFFLLFNAMGADAGALQLGSEFKDDKVKQNSILKYGFKIGIFTDIVILICILIFTNVYNFKFEGSNEILRYMSIQPLMIFLFTYQMMYYRVKLENKKFSYFNTVNSVLMLIGSIIGALGGGIIGLVLGKNISILICIVICIINSNDMIYVLKQDININKNDKKIFFRISLVSLLNNGISQLLYILDIFIIGVLIPSQMIIASYKTVTLIPTALNFIPISIMIYIYPYFAKNNKNYIWIKEKYSYLFKYIFILNLTISLFLIIFAKPIIVIVFGNEYLDSVSMFRVLSLGYFFAATFRIPSGNILNMLRELKFNFYNSLISCILNIILNIVLIKHIGSIGASISTLCVVIISGISSTIYLQICIKKNKVKVN